MKNIKIRESLKVGWGLFMKRPWYLLGLGLAATILMIVTSSDALATALASIIYAGYIAALFNHFNGNTIVFDDMFTIDTRWIFLAFLIVIKSLLIIVGLLLFIVPGIYLAIRWMFAEYLVIDKGLRPIEALKASSALTHGYRWKLFLFSLISFMLILLGLLLAGIGAIVAGTVVLLATIKIYRDLQAVEGEAVMV